MMKPRRRWVLATLTIACQSLAATELAMEPVEIENQGITLAAPVLAEHINFLDARARVVIPPTAEYIISAPLRGMLTRLYVGVGEDVVAGQVLAEVRSSEFLTLQRDFLDAVNGDALARAQLTRDGQLFDEGIISKRRVEETEARAKVAAARLGEYRQLLRLSGLSNAGIDSLGKNQRFQELLAIRAPVDGTVLELVGVTGEQIDAMDAVYRLADLTTLWLDIQVPEEQIQSVAPGMKVAVADCVVELPAEITVVGRAVDPDTQTVSVRATLTHPDHQLRPGQFVSVQIVTDAIVASRATIWAIPVGAIVRKGDECFVFVRTAAGFEIRAVNPVDTDGDLAYVEAGVSDKTRLAVTGVSALKALWANRTETDT